MGFLEVIFKRTLWSNPDCRIETFKHSFGVGAVIEAIMHFVTKTGSASHWEEPRNTFGVFQSGN